MEPNKDKKPEKRSVRFIEGKGFYIALALCLAAVGAIGYFTLIRPANVTIDDPTILDVMGLACPPEMDGKSLIVR